MDEHQAGSVANSIFRRNIHRKTGERIRFRLKPVNGIPDGVEGEGWIVGFYSRDHYKVLVDGNIPAGDGCYHIVVEERECLT